MISMLTLSRYLAQSGPGTAPVAHRAADTANSMIPTLATVATLTLALVTAAAQQVNINKLVLHGHGVIITS